MERAVEMRSHAPVSRGVIAGLLILLTTVVSAVELALIRRSLERTHGNKRQAAELLNLKRTTLIEKLKRLEPRA